MSILVKPYEISVWEDRWDANQGKFVEHKVITIGSHLMKSQNRVIKPVLTRDANGTKKFSFSLYKFYKDITTGEKVYNPFFKYLVNERKIKLKYDGKWYDFLIKNISEPSSTYLYTYQLEDAFVNELSKNGFNVELSDDAHNNCGTAEYLAGEILKGTDWTIAENSEKLVQTSEEALVYLKVTKPGGLKSCQLVEDFITTNGIDDTIEVVIPEGSYVLGFYSCCKEQTNRFQFIYVADGNYNTDDNRVIVNKNSQYYVDYVSGEYVSSGNPYLFTLPKDFLLEKPLASADNIVSSLYRGKRYVFLQEMRFSTLLDKYVGRYSANSQQYYGYIHTEYIAPKLITNLIDNNSFEDSSGWSSITFKTGDTRLELTPQYGRWNEIETEFISIQQDWGSQNFEALDDRISCLYCKCEEGVGYLTNSGFYTNRLSLKTISPNEKFVLRLKLRQDNGERVTAQTIQTLLTPSLQHFTYNTQTGHQISGSFGDYAHFSNWETEDDYCVVYMTINENVSLTENQFQNLKIRLVFEIKQSLYFEDAQLFKYISTNNGYMSLDSQATQATTVKTLKLFPLEQLDNVVDEAELSWIDIPLEDAQNFKPYHVPGAQKVKTVSIKESNYFNNLQSVAEAFEAWLDIIVDHDDAGIPTNKKISFKNYLGKTNFSGFKYGVNLKDITRTQNAQKLATKLIVKTNNNEHAENGNCSIATSSINETGENYLYNFDYYIKQGLIDAGELSEYLYNSGCLVNDYMADQLGLVRNSDIGYYSYLRILNALYNNQSELLTPLLVSKNRITGELKAQQEALKAAESTLEQMAQEFYDITQVPYHVAVPGAPGYTKPNLNPIVERWVQCYEQYVIPKQEAPQDSLPILPIVNLEQIQAPPVQVRVNQNARSANILYPTTDFVYTVSAATTTDANALTLPYHSHSLKQSLTLEFTTNDLINNSSFCNSLASFPFTLDPYYHIEKIEYRTTSLENWVQTDYTYINGQISFTIDKKILSCSCKIYLTLDERAWQENNTVDFNREDVQKLLLEIEKATLIAKKAAEDIQTYNLDLTQLNNQIGQISAIQSAIKKEKEFINYNFYSKYSRFIQEGTWIDEKYVDANTYYMDAQSVLYESCQPAVSYNINVLELSQLPGYELFTFDIGDKTFVQDKDFCGDEGRIEVIVTAIVNNLDQPELNSLKMQTYKNQFQDLFQKITATVQTTQYRSGAYEKTSLMLDAESNLKQAFLKNSVDDLTDLLSNAGEATVQQTNLGILIKEPNNKGKQMHITAGAILLGTFDTDNSEEKWVTGLSTGGISANLITTGSIDTGSIQIKNGNDSTFRWDAYGISAFEFGVDSYEGKIGVVNPYKFVRFDQYGLYGIDGTKNGLQWKPSGTDPIKEINREATFSLTWEGLKVTGNNNVEARIGKDDENIINITDSNSNSIFRVRNDGSSEIAGWTISSQTGYNGGFFHDAILAEANGAEQKYRFGMKIEDGDSEKFAWYVKEYQKTDTSSPTGPVVFGVRYNGGIKATKGEIAGFKIDSNAIMKRVYNKDDNSTYYTFMQAGTAVGNTAFAVRKAVGDHTGYNTSPTWEQIFNVDYKGKLITKNIEATGGKIAGWYLIDDNLSATSIINGGYSEAGITLNPQQITFKSGEEEARFGSGGIHYISQARSTGHVTDAQFGTSSWMRERVGTHASTAAIQSYWTGHGIEFARKLDKSDAVDSVEAGFNAEYDLNKEIIYVYIMYDGQKYYFNGSGFSTTRPS